MGRRVESGEIGSRRWARAVSLAGPLALGCLVSVACLDAGAPTRVTLADGDLRILFVGNSLTYTNDLPGAVATISAALGHDVAVASVARPNFALEDHWHTGIRDVVYELAPDVVVMQQGPSSLPENQLHLAAWSDSLSRLARGVGAEPALLMVWPSLSREDAFDDVRDAYRDAAVGVGGLFLPAGEGVRALYERHPDIWPFGPDGFHPSEYGTLVAAFIVVGGLFGDPVEGLPARLDPPSAGGRAIALDLAAAAVLHTVADSVVQAWR